MALTALRRAPPARSPQREALAQAIERLRDATAQRAALATALQSAEAEVRRANAAVAAGEAGVEEAKAATSAHMVSVASGTAGDPPRTIRQARNALQDAEDQREAARAARDQLKALQAEPSAIDVLRMNLSDAIDRVLVAEASAQARAVVEAAYEARERLARATLLTQFLDHRGLFEKNSVNGITLLSQYPISESWDADRQSATATWRAAIERLAGDADAVLDL
jgi:DNA repair exonuclease SbcCD ATPase subunit